MRTQPDSSTVVTLKNGRTPRHWSKAERRQIVEEALKPGASVSLVSRAHDVNTFQGKSSSNKKELPVYALLLAKSGIQFENAPDSATSVFDVGAGGLTGYGVSMGELAEQLSRGLDLPGHRQSWNRWFV